MKIRRAVPEDAQVIKTIHVTTYQTSYRGYLPDDELDQMMPDEEHIQRTKAYIQKVECWVAEENDQVIGFAYVVYPEPDAFEIQALYVHPHFQHKGGGSLLVSTLCSDKKEKGFHKLIVWTLKNGPSIGFYQKMGLSPVIGQEKMWKYNLPIIRFEKEL